MSEEKKSEVDSINEVSVNEEINDEGNVESKDQALELKIEELEKKLIDAKDQSLRSSAELQNIRRRSEQDVQKAHKFALEKFSSDLLPVIDTLERALEMSVVSEETKDMREGIELTIKMFQDALKRHHLEAIDPLGEPFSPDHHQAMSMEVSDKVEPGSVLKVFQKGYLLNGRLIRPAMVVVSKAAE